MHKYIYKFLITAALCFFIGVLCTENTKCNCYIDDDGYVCIEMKDHRRTSNIFYRTFEFDISRCVYDPCAKQLHSGSATEFIRVSMNELYNNVIHNSSGGTEYNTWRIHINDILSAGSSEWQEEVRKALDGTGPAVYIRYDSVMYTCTYRGEQLVPLTGPHENCPPKDGTNPSEIQRAQAWGPASIKDLEQHYNRYLLIGKSKEVPAIPPMEVDEYISAERSPIEFWTGNYSDTWNLYQSGNPYSGIPSGEYVSRNEAKASRWWGETEVYARTKTTRDYANIGYQYKILYAWMEAIYEEQVVGHKPDGTEIRDRVHVRDEERNKTIVIDSGNYYTNKYEPSDKTIMVPAVSYEYLYNASFYQLEEMDVYNNAFESYLFYPGAEVPMTCYSTNAYENVATGSRIEPANWNPDNEKHITWAKRPSDVDMYLFGGEKLWAGDPRIGQANDEAEKQFKRDRARIMDEIFSGTQTKNDSLVVDGVPYLVGEGAPGYAPSIGVNWLTIDMEGLSEKEILHTYCTESSAMKNPFVVGSISGANIGLVEDSASDIFIPEETDNGKYPTAMKVCYSRKIKNDSQVVRFSAGKDQFLESVNFTDGRGASMRGNAGFNALFNNTVDCGPLEGCGHSGLSSYTKLQPIGGSVTFGAVKGHLLGFDRWHGIIYVHTPVISPIRIWPDTWSGDSDSTQMLPNAQLDTAEYKSEATQFVLDNYYVIEWSEMDHVNSLNYGNSADYGSPYYRDPNEKYSKYDKYVLDKWIKFPWDVEYDGTYYPKDTWIKVRRPESYKDSSNYQGAAQDNNWMPSSENDWRKLVFYIPSYARECGGNTDKDCYIKVFVEAQNTDGRFFDDHNPEVYWAEKEDGEVFTPDGWENSWEHRANRYTTGQYSPVGAQYVTYFQEKVQLSGVIYDFMIVGSDDDDTFRYKDTGDHISGAVVPFCVYKEEKRVGLYNRYGLEPTSSGLFSAVRYRADGMIAIDEATGLPAWSPVNTLALQPGKSNCWNNMGYLIKGTTFSFSFKTIANLSDSKTDYARIKPGFRYYSTETGKWSENIKIYYNSHVRDHHATLVEFNPDKKGSDLRDWDEKNRRIFKLSDEQFRMSYYNYRNTSIVPNQVIGDWIVPTVKRYNELRGLTGSNAFTEEEYMNKDNESYCLSDIYLASDTLMLSGEWEQLGRNTRGLGRESSDYGNGLLTYAMVPGNWNGADSGEKWTYTPAQQEKFIASMQTWFGQYFVPSELYIVDLDNPKTQQIINNAGLTPETFDLTEYMKTKDPGMRLDDDIFEKNNGYLVINFDIETFNSTSNGSPANPHLKYYGGYDGSVNMWDKEGFNPDPGPNIPTDELKNGDVAIIDLNRSINDRYRAGIFNIN